MSKDVGLRIRIDERLRRNFVNLCRQQDRTAAQVLREFMRAYVEENLTTAQYSLFPEETIGRIFGRKTGSTR
jgi:hypothetical protein